MLGRGLSISLGSGLQGSVTRDAGALGCLSSLSRTWWARMGAASTRPLLQAAPSYLAWAFGVCSPASSQKYQLIPEVQLGFSGWHANCLGPLAQEAQAGAGTHRGNTALGSGCVLTKGMGGDRQCPSLQWPGTLDSPFRQGLPKQVRQLRWVGWGVSGPGRVALQLSPALRWQAS